jgi:hypothetical protein
MRRRGAGRHRMEGRKPHRSFSRSHDRSVYDVITIACSFRESVCQDLMISKEHFLWLLQCTHIFHNITAIAAAHDFD